MKIELEFLELTKPLFHCGCNMGDKLGKGSKYPDAQLYYDSEERRAEVHFKGRVSWVSEANWTSATPKVAGLSTPAPQYDPPTPNKKIKAQVSSPTHHVFGEGPGKTHD